MNIKNKILLLIIFIFILPLVAHKNFLLTEDVIFNIGMWDTVNIYDWAVSFYIHSLKPIKDFWYPYLFQIYFYPFSYPGNYLLLLKSFFSLLLSFIIWINYFKKDFGKTILFLLICIFFYFVLDLKYQDRYYLSVLLFISYFLIFNNSINYLTGYICSITLGTFLFLYEPNLFLIILCTFILYLVLYTFFNYFYFGKVHNLNKIKKIIILLLISIFIPILFLVIYFNFSLSNLIYFYFTLSDIFEYASWKFDYKIMYDFFNGQSILIQLTVFLFLYCLSNFYFQSKSTSLSFKIINQSTFIFCLTLILGIFVLKSIMRDVNASLLFLPLLIIFLIMIEKNYHKNMIKYLSLFLLFLLFLNINIFIDKYKYFINHSYSFLNHEKTSDINFKTKGLKNIDQIKNSFQKKIPDLKNVDLYIVGDHTYLYPLLDKKNKFYTNNFYNTSPFTIQDKLINQIKDVDPKYIVLHKFDGSFYEIRHSLRVAKLFNFLSKNYVPFKTVEHFDVLMKSDKNNLIHSYWFTFLSNKIYLKKIPYYYEPNADELYIEINQNQLLIDKTKNHYIYHYTCNKIYNIEVYFDIDYKSPKNIFYIPKKVLWLNC